MTGGLRPEADNADAYDLRPMDNSLETDVWTLEGSPVRLPFLFVGTVAGVWLFRLKLRS